MPIHLIQIDPGLLPWPVDIGQDIYESGYWDLSLAKANHLVGQDIYFHERQDAPSFFGGIIQSFKISNNAPWRGRVIFTFKALQDHKNIKTNRAGWSMEMKIA